MSAPHLFCLPAPTPLHKHTTGWTSTNGYGTVGKLARCENEGGIKKMGRSNQTEHGKMKILQNGFNYENYGRKKVLQRVHWAIKYVAEVCISEVRVVMW